MRQEWDCKTQQKCYMGAYAPYKPGNLVLHHFKLQKGEEKNMDASKFINNMWACFF